MTEAEGARALFKQVADRVDERLFGVREPLGLVMVGILTGNHVLIDDVPGVGKTTLVRMLSTLLGLRFQRVQFTPDLMPSDITGTSVLNLKTNDFEFRPGPLFTQVLLADEINRATPKTQAALLEAMQERQVTVDGETHPLPDPFFVLATQNPIELEGTFPLPEAQLDRFLLRVKLGYPDEREELRILQTQPAERTLPREPLADRPPLRELRDAIASIGLEQPVRAYVVALARASRNHPELSVGASPRAVEQMGDAARAFAMTPAMPRSRAMRPACTGPAPPKASSMKSRRSWPRMVEIALIASSIFTSMTRIMPSAASGTSRPSGLATAASIAARALAASSRIRPPRKFSGSM